MLIAAPLLVENGHSYSCTLLVDLSHMPIVKSPSSVTGEFIVIYVLLPLNFNPSPPNLPALDSISTDCLIILLSLTKSFTVPSIAQTLDIRAVIHHPV